MKKLTALLLGVLLLGSYSGCATITRGTSEAYLIISDPPGASAHLSTGQTCITPCTLPLKRNSSFSIRLEKNGFESTEIQVTNQSCEEGNMALAGDMIMLGGLLWAGIDKISGATRNLTPNPCDVKLVPREATGG